MSEEEIKGVVCDTIYDCYKLDNDMEHTRYIHPMFYNGSFSKDYPLPPKPKPLMEREVFIEWIGKEETEWTKAIEVLGVYIMRQNKDE